LGRGPENLSIPVCFAYASNARPTTPARSPGSKTSDASNLGGNPNVTVQVFLRDLDSGVLEPISSLLGSTDFLEQGDLGQLSPDGRFVVFDYLSSTVSPRAIVLLARGGHGASRRRAHAPRGCRGYAGEERRVRTEGLGAAKAPSPPDIGASDS
jgi:hypothetical protein